MKTKDKDRYTFSSVCHKLSERKYDKGKAPEDIKLLVELAECYFTGSAAAAVATAGAPSVAGAFTFATVIKTISEKGKVLDAAKRIMELLSKPHAPGGTTMNETYEGLEVVYTEDESVYTKRAAKVEDHLGQQLVQ